MKYKVRIHRNRPASTLRDMAWDVFVSEEPSPRVTVFAHSGFAAEVFGSRLLRVEGFATVKAQKAGKR